ncbi:MAG: hypothetical protein AMXMBFR6_09170 [Betaproteobacteria bacterium]|nr:hypothetical protein [Rhodocyclaceae bacterium]
MASDIEVVSPSALIGLLDAWLAPACSPPPHQAPLGALSALDLDEALCSKSWADLTAEAEANLDRLRKKIEVVRKLYRYYLPDMSGPANPTPLSPEALQRLCALLLKAALLRNDMRYLNSALKLLDGILDQDEGIFQEDLRRLAALTLDALVPPALGAA